MARKRTIDGVREHLFKALEGLSDNSLDLDRAKAISEIAQTIINSAKVEVDFIRASGNTTSAFLESGQVGEELPPGIVGIRQHRIAG